MYSLLNLMFSDDDKKLKKCAQWGNKYRTKPWICLAPFSPC